MSARRAIWGKIHDFYGLKVFQGKVKARTLNRWDRKLIHLSVAYLHFILPNVLTYVRPCMPVILLVPSDSPTLIFYVLRFSAHYFPLAVLALQPLKFGTLSLHLSILLIPSIVTSRPTVASRPSNQLNPSLLVPQSRLLLTIVRIYKLLADSQAPFGRSGISSSYDTGLVTDRRRHLPPRTPAPYGGHVGPLLQRAVRTSVSHHLRKPSDAQCWAWY